MLPAPSRGPPPAKLPPRLLPQGGECSGHPRAPGQGAASDGKRREQEGGGVCSGVSPEGREGGPGQQAAGLLDPRSARPRPCCRTSWECLGRKRPLSPQAEKAPNRGLAILPSDLAGPSYLSRKKGFSWGSQGKNTRVLCHSLLQWTAFCQAPTLGTCPPAAPRGMPGALGVRCWSSLSQENFTSSPRIGAQVLLGRCVSGWPSAWPARACASQGCSLRP